ncbi:MAG: 16S rRNA (cytosine(967)-C(5))-methyltransferase RsmB [Firmicutes bacterium HGW-Firmicutes-21]|nr:MAG: 16S rRNA (cytosine(967)-C(5))-methyltransferase RsmB [Firmicutes bacterium HGW-Firmicutes-21]
MSDKKIGTRYACYDILRKIQENKAYSNLIMSNLKESYGLDQMERRFVRSLVLGVLERQMLLDYILSFFINKKADAEIQLLLRIGLHQQLFMEVPPSAACNETVKVAKAVFDRSRAGFINGVLRNIGRSEKKVADALESAPPHIKYSVNESIYKLLNEQYGDKAEKILAAFIGRKPLLLRVNTLKINTIDLVEKLVRRGVEAEFLSETTVTIGKGSSHVIERLKKGEYFIQGLGSQKAVALLAAAKGQTVVDVCACPGGKSFGAAIDMENKGLVISLDIHEKKLPLIDRYSDLLGIDIITTRAFDSRQVYPELVEKADRVICDVPCSGLGVISAKPEIRYKSVEDFGGLYQTQRRIISSASKYLKSGGIMVYSTCTLNRHENEEIVAGFLADNNGFELVYERTYFPFDEVGEGFYIAKIVRK